MRIRSKSLANPPIWNALITETDQGIFFTSFGVGTMTEEAAQLSDAAKAVFVNFYSLCEASGRWQKELTFFQIRETDSAERRVREALTNTENNTAIFFVCATVDECHAVRTILNLENFPDLH